MPLLFRYLAVHFKVANGGFMASKEQSHVRVEIKTYERLKAQAERLNVSITGLADLLLSRGLSLLEQDEKENIQMVMPEKEKEGK